jgi:tetratricopeptide (TPR) repeat protein
MLRSRVSLLAWVCAWSVVAAAPARLQAQAKNPPPAEPAADDELSPLERAHAHFLLGLDYFRARDFRKALAEFEHAAKLSPTADLWFNIGRAHEELGQYAEAASAFDRYLRDRVDAPDAPAVKARIAKLNTMLRAMRTRQTGERELGSLRIRGGVAGSLVFLDGQPLSAAAEPLLLPVGRHRFDVTQPGHIPLHAVVDIQPGLLTTANAELRPAHFARTLPAVHGIDYALFGVAGAALLASGTFATLSAIDRADGSLGDARAWAVRADVSLVGTALCALAAGLLYVATKQGARTELQPAARSR